MNRCKSHIGAWCALMLFALCAPVSASGKTEDGGDVLCVRGLQNDSTVLAGTAQSGIYRSVDGGRSWTQTSLNEGSVRVLTPDPRSAAHFYAGTGQGLYATIDGGGTWWPIDTSLHATALAVSLSGARSLLAADGSVVRRTTDDGKSWSTIEVLSSYGIRLLSSVRTDTGSVFVAASDSVILFTTEKNQAVWQKLPALPANIGQRVRICALACDTMSMDGMQIVAGTSAGVYVYSPVRNEWQHLQNGLPEGAIGAMGFIVYDTTSSSRSYSLCVSIARNTMTAFPSTGVYKISSVSGTIGASFAWNPIADEQIDVRDCFMPDRGANRAKIYLASSDGLRISYDGGTTWAKIVLRTYPVASIPLRYYRAGIVGPMGVARVAVRVFNPGHNALAIHIRGISDTKNFTILSADSLDVPSGSSAEVPVQFNPSGPGKFSAQMAIETNDPASPTFSITIAGFCTGLGIQSRTVVIDRSHGGEPAGSFADLAKALTLAGMSVIDTLPSAVLSDCAMIILPGPSIIYTDAECSIIARQASAGASIVAFGSAEDSSRSVLNRLFASTIWKTIANAEVPISVGTSRVSSITGAIAAAKYSSLRSAAYLAHADTFGFVSATEVIASGAHADTLCAADGVTRTDASGAHPGMKAVLGAVARIGSGKVIAIGDAHFWCADSAAGEAAGLWAADNFTAALSIAGTIETGDVGFPGKTPNEAYTLLSIPYQLTDNAVASVLRGFGKPDPYMWRLFGAWNGQTQLYGEYPSPALMTIDRGKGYWLITKGERELQPGPADYSSIPEPFVLTLKPGFTLIGDPFPFAIDWRRAVAATPSVESKIWSYNGKEFTPTSFMQPYEGYFVCNTSDTDAVVTVRPEPVIITSTLDKEASSMAAPMRSGAYRAGSEGEWSMRVSATDGTVNDGDNYCGMLRTSVDTRDVNDLTEPPVPPGRFIAFRFTGTEKAALAGDYRSVNADGAFWNCDVRSSEAGSHVNISLAPETPLPAGYGVYIVDFADERVIDCSANASYEFTMKNGESARALRIIAGENKYIGQHTGGIPMTPLTYTLEQNFPNPWNPATTIRYTIAHSGNTRLEIFNLLGQKVRTLADGMQALGTYAQEWDGKDDKGAPAASGVYIYRLTTPAFSQSKRMVLLR